MRIIKQGKKREDKEITTNCPQCDTRFAFCIREAYETIYDQREGGYIHRIDCPTCNYDCVGYPD